MKLPWLDPLFISCYLTQNLFALLFAYIVFVLLINFQKFYKAITFLVFVPVCML